MLCERCQRELRNPERQRLDRFPPVVLPEDKMATVDVRQGLLFSTVGSVAARAAKVSQLSRFGLGGEDQPLFTS